MEKTSREKLQDFLKERFGNRDPLFIDFKTPKDVIKERAKNEKKIQEFMNAKLP